MSVPTVFVSPVSPQRAQSQYHSPFFQNEAAYESSHENHNHREEAPAAPADTRLRPRLPSISTLALPGLDRRPSEELKKSRRSTSANVTVSRSPRHHPYFSSDSSGARFSLRESLAKSDLAIEPDEERSGRYTKVSKSVAADRQKSACDCCGKSASRFGPRGRNTLCSNCGLSFLRRIKSLEAKKSPKCDVEEAVQGFVESRVKYLEYKQSKAPSFKTYPSPMSTRQPSFASEEEPTPPASPISAASTQDSFHSHHSHTSHHSSYYSSEDSQSYPSPFPPQPAFSPSFSNAYHLPQHEQQPKPTLYKSLALPPRLEVAPPHQYLGEHNTSPFSPTHKQSHSPTLATSLPPYRPPLPTTQNDRLETATSPCYKWWDCSDSVESSSTSRNQSPPPTTAFSGLLE